MKNPLLILLLTVASFCGSAQEDARDKAKVFGCLPYQENTFIKQTEVRIADWFGYLYSVNEEDAFQDDDFEDAEVRTMLPKEIDQSNKFLIDIFLRIWTDEWKNTKTTWNKKTIKTFPLYLNKIEKKELEKINRFLNKPITGLTHFQVQEYLSWQGEELDNLLSDADDFHHQVELIPIQLYDTLLSKYTAGLRAAEDDNGVKLVVGDSVNTQGCQLYNFKGNGCPAEKQRLALYGTLVGPVSVYSYNPDVNGFYNLMGNVAEMSATKGVAKGGHYEMYGSEILKTEGLNYDQPSKLIGFRYLVKLIKN